MRIAKLVRSCFVPLPVFIFVSLTLPSCRSSSDSSKPPAVLHANQAAPQVVFPDGWSVISGKEKSFAEEIRLMKNDGAASMTARVLRPVASAKEMLEDEDVCTLGNISMQHKLGNGGGERRILRLPSAIGNGSQFCVYLYSQNSLLRRVLVFRARGVIYELELAQESASLTFSSVVEAQTSFAKSLVNGRH